MWQPVNVSPSLKEDLPYLLPTWQKDVVLSNKQYTYLQVLIANLETFFLLVETWQLKSQNAIEEASANVQFLYVKWLLTDVKAHSDIRNSSGRTRQCGSWKESALK